MGLIDEKCDSCGQETTVLIPLAILDELPTGGTRMIIKYYCKGCADMVLEEAENLENEDEKESKNQICACCNKKIIPDEGEHIDSYYCHGCGLYICLTCSLTLEIIGKHLLKDHREACRKAKNHL